MQRHPPRCPRPAAHLVGLSDPVCCIDAKCASDASLLYELLSKRRPALLAHEPKHRCSRCLKESLRSTDYGERPCAIVCRRGNVRFAFALCLAVALFPPIICNGADRKESGRPWIATVASNPTDRLEICLTLAKAHRHGCRRATKLTVMCVAPNEVSRGADWWWRGRMNE